MPGLKQPEETSIPIRKSILQEDHKINFKFKILNLKLLGGFLYILLLIASFQLPVVAQSTNNCGGGNPARAEGLVTADSLSSLSKFGSSGACAIDSSVAFDLTGNNYLALRSKYYDQSKLTKNKITSLPVSFSVDGIYLVSGNLTTSGTPSGNGTEVIFVEGDLIINSNITYHTADAGGGLVFVVNGKVVISKTVTQVNAVIITQDTIYTAGDGCNTSSVTESSPGTPISQLNIYGSLISLSDKPIKFCRRLANNNSPAEVVNAQIKYLVLLRNILSDTVQKWAEIDANTPLPSANPSFVPSPTPAPPIPTAIPSACPTGSTVKLGTANTQAKPASPVSVAAFGSYAYVANQQDATNSTLQKFNITGTNPSLAASVVLDSLPISIALDPTGTYIYVVTNSNKLQKIDANSLAVIGSVTTGTNPRAVFVSGGFVYVVSGTSQKLEKFSTNGSGAPILKGFVGTGSGSFPASVFVSGNSAYVADSNGNTLQRYDVSADTPTFTSSVSTNGKPTSVYVSGNYAYVINYDAKLLQKYDISTSTPQLKGSASTIGYSYGVYASGNDAYVVNSELNALERFNVSGDTPVQICYTSTDTQPYALAASGNDIFVINLNSSTLQRFSQNYFDFKMATSSNITLTQGNSASTTLTNTQTYGATSQSVSISTTLPAGATISFTNNPCSPTCSNTVTISTDVSTAPGIYPITLTGTASGGLQKTATFSLIVNGTSCTTGYKDMDKDTFGAGALGCYATSTSYNIVLNNSDCYDLNANAKPGQTGYFGATRGTSAQGNDSSGNTWNSFDYNCDGSNSKQFAYYTGSYSCPYTDPGCNGWSSTCGVATSLISSATCGSIGSSYRYGCNGLGIQTYVYYSDGESSSCSPGPSGCTISNSSPTDTVSCH